MMPVLDDLSAKVLFPEEFGTRQSKIREYKLNPITDIDEINRRLDTIEALVEDQELLKEIVSAQGVSTYKYSRLFDSLDVLVTAREMPESDRIGQAAFVYHALEFVHCGYLEDLAAKDQDNPFLKKVSGDVGKALQDPLLQEFISVSKPFYDRIEEFEQGLPEDADKSEEIGKFVLSTVDLKKLSGYREVTKVYERVAKDLSQVDEFRDLAIEAKEFNLVRPTILPREENCIIIEAGFNETDSDSVPNDMFLKEFDEDIYEGPNNAGKTYWMRVVGRIASRALSGNFVPAQSATISIRDRVIFREKGVGDERSAFQQDNRTVKELDPAPDEYWLSGVDEIYTSTERRGGGSLVYGLSKRYVDQGKSKLLLSNHYPELSDPLIHDDRVAFHHFPFHELTPEEIEELPRHLADRPESLISFSHKKTDGPLLNYSYALSVAQSIGFDPEIIRLAQKRIQARGYQ